MEYNYDIIIIGSGPGGEGAAMKATRNGQKVAIIEDDAIGGGCNNWGTIPSKALRQLSREVWYNKKNFDFPEMLDTAYEIVIKQREIKRNRFANNEIDVFYGFASFIDKHKIKFHVKMVQLKSLRQKNSFSLQDLVHIILMILTLLILEFWIVINF